MQNFFIEQMAMYSSYHRDLRNKLTHFIGVPSIAFSLMLAMALLPLGDFGGMTVTLATLFYVSVSLYWIMLDRPVGIVTALVHLPLYLAAAWLAETRPAGDVWILFAVFFFGGWVFQLLGHVFEGRKPALTDNLLQIFIAPSFLVAEIFFALGLRKNIAGAVEARWRDFLPADADSPAGEKPSRAAG